MCSRDPPKTTVSMCKTKVKIEVRPRGPPKGERSKKVEDVEGTERRQGEAMVKS